MSVSPIPRPLPAPRCCDDAAGGEMVRDGDGWLCVWCGRRADAQEPYRQLRPPPPPPQRPAPTTIPSDGRPTKC